jgi:lipopolysaccharide export system protein LptA
MKHAFVAYILFALLCFSSNAQDRIRVINADNNSYRPDENRARVLTGNVKIEHQGILLFCDTALYFQEENLAKAYGHTQINQADTLNVYGDTIYYEGNLRIATVFGDVKLVDDNSILRAPILVYKLDSNVAYYDKGGFMYDSETGDTLVSDVGTYYGNQKLMDFTGNVYYRSSDYLIESDRMLYDSKNDRVIFKGPTTITSDNGDVIKCERGWYDVKNDISSFSGNGEIINNDQNIKGDSIIYDRVNGNGEIFGNMIVVDTASDFEVTGDYGKINQKTGEYLVTGDPLFKKFENEDTLWLKADTLLAKFDSITNESRIQAYYNVRFINSSMTGKCDSMYYSEKDSVLEMYDDPIVWKDSSQISGDTILMDIYKGEIDHIWILNKAFLISMADSVGFNQVSGKRMKGLFSKNELNRMFVYGNGQTIYYAENDEDGYIGMDKSVCTDIRIEMEDADIREIVFIKKPESVLYPMDDIKEDDRLLKGFKWDWDLSKEIQIEFLEIDQ